MSRVRVITRSAQTCEWLLRALRAQNHWVEIASPGEPTHSPVDFEIEPNLEPRDQVFKEASSFLSTGGNVFASASAFPEHKESAVDFLGFQEDAEAADISSIAQLQDFVETDQAAEIAGLLDSIEVDAPNPLAAEPVVNMASDPQDDLAFEHLQSKSLPRDSYLSQSELDEISEDVAHYHPSPYTDNSEEPKKTQSIAYSTPRQEEENHNVAVGETVTSIGMTSQPAEPPTQKPAPALVPFVLPRNKMSEPVKESAEQEPQGEWSGTLLHEAMGVTKESGRFVASKAKLSAIEAGAWLASLRTTLAERRQQIDQTVVTRRTQPAKRLTEAQLHRSRTVFAISALLALAVTVVLALFHHRPNAISEMFPNDSHRTAPAPIVDARPPATQASPQRVIKTLPNQTPIQTTSQLKSTAARPIRRIRQADDGPEVIVHRYQPKPQIPPSAVSQPGVKKFSDIASN